MVESKSVGIVITFGIAALIGVILLEILAGNVVTKTQLMQATDTVDISPVKLAGNGQTINYSANIRMYATSIISHPASTGWQTDYSDCAITRVHYYNQTGALMSSADDYTWVEDGNGGEGWLRPKNVLNLNQSGSNLTTVVYSYCPNDYLIQGWQRTIFSLVPGFFALAILIGGAFVIFYILKQEGIKLD